MHTSVYTNLNNAGLQYFPGSNESSMPQQKEHLLRPALDSKDMHIMFKGKLTREPQNPVPELIVPSFLESEEFLWTHDPQEARKRFDSLG